MNTVTVRQAAAADIEALAVLFDQYRQFQGQAGNLADARSFLAERFDHGESIVFIATAGGSAVDFAQLYPSFSSVSLSRVFILNDLLVLESARDRRVASQLPLPNLRCTRLATAGFARFRVRLSSNVRHKDTPSDL